MEHLARSSDTSFVLCTDSEYRTHGLQLRILLSPKMWKRRPIRYYYLENELYQSELENLPRQWSMLSFRWGSRRTLPVMLLKVSKLLLEMINSTAKTCLCQLSRKFLQERFSQRTVTRGFVSLHELVVEQHSFLTAACVRNRKKKILCFQAFVKH